MSGGLGAWLKERVPVDLDRVGVSLNEPIPNHLKSWWWCLGGTPAFLFLVQVATGMLLTLYYVPTPANAYDSVARISRDIPFGWWLRSIHKWSSSFMIVALVLHVFRVYFTAAYRRPRELTWVSGALILLVTFILGFTGYSLVYEQLSFWGATVASNLVATVPFIGEPLARFIRGGDAIGADTLTRFYIFHIALLPTILVLLLAVHILFVRLHGVTEFNTPGEKPQQSFKFYPDHILTELMLGIGLMVVLTCFAVIFPAGLAERANPLETPAHIKPEWSFYFSFRWLKLAGLTTAVLSMGFAAFIFIVWPFVERLLIRVLGRDPSTFVGITAVLVVIALTVWEALAH